MGKDDNKKPDTKPEEAKAVEAAEKVLAAKETEAQAEPQGMPQAPQNVATMSERQKVLWQIAQTGKEPRIVESVRDLAPDIKMQVPACIKDDYPERTYRWADASKLRDEIEREGGFWAPVTRSTHPRVPERYFDLATGLILFGGVDNGNALVYTHKHNADIKQRQVMQRYHAREKAQESALNAPLRDANGTEIGQMYQTDKLGAGYDNTELTDDSYDFGDPR